MDPRLNEHQILRALDDAQIALTPNGVRSLCSLVLVTCYDRRVVREFMAEIIDLTTEISIIIADLECASRMRAILEERDPERDPKVLDAKITALCAEFMALRKRIAEKFALVVQCPTASDSIS